MSNPKYAQLHEPGNSYEQKDFLRQFDNNGRYCEIPTGTFLNKEERRKTVVSEIKPGKG